MNDKTPFAYFTDGIEARRDGLPHSACQLIFKSWPLECWQMGWRLADIEAIVSAGQMQEQPLERVLERPYDQGVVAAIKGLFHDACPYEPASKDYFEWQQGFQDQLYKQIAIRTKSVQPEPESYSHTVWANAKKELTFSNVVRTFLIFIYGFSIGVYLK